MNYLTDTDIKKQCTPEDLQVLSQSDEATKTSAEASTISFFRGYLKRFDVEAIFAVTIPIPNPDPRNSSLVMFMIDYLLYILYSAQPDRLIPDIRVRRRDEAVIWLEGISKGLIAPDFPLVTDSDGNDTNSPFKWGSVTRVSGTW